MEPHIVPIPRHDDRVYPGVFVRFAPRQWVARSTEELPAGAVGVVRDPDPRDIGVIWIGHEHEEPTRGWVFDPQDLEIITARDFALAVLGLPPDPA